MRNDRPGPPETIRKSARRHRRLEGRVGALLGRVGPARVGLCRLSVGCLGRCRCQAVPGSARCFPARARHGRHRRPQRGRPARGAGRQRPRPEVPFPSRSSSPRTARPTRRSRSRRGSQRDARVRVLDLPRGGQTAAQRAIFEAARGEIVVLTDAETRFAPGCLAALVAPFADPRVGAATGRLAWLDEDRTDDVPQRGRLLALRAARPSPREPGGLADGRDRRAARGPGSAYRRRARPRLDGPPPPARGARPRPRRAGGPGGGRKRPDGRRPP